MQVEATKEEKLDRVLKLWQARGRYNLLANLEKQEWAALDNVLPLAVTDADGRFEVRGVGVERIAILMPSGPGIGQTRLDVATRPDIDFTAYDRAVWKNAAAYIRRAEAWLMHLRGPTFDYVVAPGREISGTVRDATSGKPVDGVTVTTGTGGGGNTIQVVTDRAGYYRIEGLQPLEQYSLYAVPSAASLLLPRAAHIRAPQGLRPMVHDIELRRGFSITGRVVDAAAGKGIPGYVNFRPLEENGRLLTETEAEERGISPVSSTTDETGRYGLIVSRVPGLLLATALPDPLAGDEKIAGIAMNPYLPAKMDAALLKRLGLERPTGHACRLFDHAPTSSGPYDLLVHRGRSLPVEVQDADGKPVFGAIVDGIDVEDPVVPLAGSTCTVCGLAPGQARLVVAFHVGRALGGTVLLRGDETKRAVVQLQATGAISGRVVDLTGRPVSGLQVAAWPREERFLGIYGYLWDEHEPVHTDNDGRFRLLRIMPEVEFRLIFGQDETRRVSVPPLALIKIAPGETRDIGDVRTKPR